VKSKAKPYLCLIASILFVQIAFSQGKVYTQGVDSSYFHFKNAAYFSGAKFNSLADFRGTTFDSMVNFERARFNSEVNFFEATFNSLADFSEVIFNESPSFYNTIIPDTLLFQKVQLNNGSILDLNTIVLKAGRQKCIIDLREFPIDKIKLRWDNFNLYYPLGKRSHQFNYQEIRGVYNDLLKRFSDLGYTASYEECDKEFREFQYKYDPGYKAGIGFLLNFIDNFWWGYGYDLWRIALNSLIILLIFTVINYFQFKQLNEDVYKITRVYDAYQNKSGLKFTYVLIYTSLIFFGISLKIDNFYFARLGSAIWLLFQFVVGLLCLAFIVNHILG